MIYFLKMPNYRHKVVKFGVLLILTIQTSFWILSSSSWFVSQFRSLSQQQPIGSKTVYSAQMVSRLCSCASTCICCLNLAAGLVFWDALIGIDSCVLHALCNLAEVYLGRSHYSPLLSIFYSSVLSFETRYFLLVSQASEGWCYFCAYGCRLISLEVAV